MSDQVSNSAVSMIAHTPPRSRWRPWRVVRRGVAGAALAIAALVGVHYIREYLAEREVQAALAEADRVDPGWRFEDLEASRAEIPTGENSEVYVTKAGGAGITLLNMGTNRKDLGDATLALDLLAPRDRLTKRQTEALRAALKPLAGPLADGRKLADLPKGRYPFDTSPAINFPVVKIDHASITRWLLRSEALLLIEEGESVEAWWGTRGILNIGRSFGDEPLAISQNQRLHHAAWACRLMERVLAQGSVSDAELAATMRLLQEELQHPALLIALRGIRAHWHSSLAQVEAGKISLGELKLGADRTYGVPGFNDELQGYFLNRQVKPAHAWLLRYSTQAVEVAKRDSPDTESALIKLEATIADAPPLAQKLARQYQWLRFQPPCRARIGCAHVGLAAERYRLKHDQWPTTLGELVAAGLLDEVPTDPFDGQPLRYRTTKDGIAIYAVGPNGAGKGDALDGDIKELKDDRLEFRLWNPEKR
jgi:hypothetical protein